MPDNNNPKSKNPSRKSCEKIIERILMTEILEKGRNQQFKSAADFMPFFESLYPASPSLNKQVQRAVVQMGLPKDRNGFFIINKTEAQIEEDEEIEESTVVEEFQKGYIYKEHVIRYSMVKVAN